MKQTISFGQFQDAFYNMDRQNQFTYKGKKALFEFLEEYEDNTDEEIELDEEFTTKFIKAKDAVGEEVFYISTRDGFTSKEVVFTIGNNNTNSVSFAINIANSYPNLMYCNNVSQLLREGLLMNTILKKIVMTS